MADGGTHTFDCGWAPAIVKVKLDVPCGKNIHVKRFTFMLFIRGEIVHPNNSLPAVRLQGVCWCVRAVMVVVVGGGTRCTSCRLVNAPNAPEEAPHRKRGLHSQTRVHLSDPQNNPLSTPIQHGGKLRTCTVRSMNRCRACPK